MRRENKFKIGRNKLLWGNNGRKCLDSIPHLSSNVFPLFYLSLSFHLSLSLSLGLYLFLSLSRHSSLCFFLSSNFSFYRIHSFFHALSLCLNVLISLFLSLYHLVCLYVSLYLSLSVPRSISVSHSFSSSAQNLQFDLNNIYLNSKMIHQ